jgi:hypothetical protein
MTRGSDFCYIIIISHYNIMTDDLKYVVIVVARSHQLAIALIKLLNTLITNNALIQTPATDEAIIMTLAHRLLL